MKNRYSPKLRATGLALVTSFVGPSAFARPPEAGTLIEGVGTVSYLNTRLGISETLRSDPVLTEVLKIDSFAVSQDQQFLRAPGDNALFAFKISNTGNTDIDILADFSDIVGDFDLVRAVPWVDENQNGRIDAADRQLDPAVPISLSIGESDVVLVDALVPATAEANQSVTGLFSGRLSATDVVQSVSGTLVIVEEAASLVKSADVTEATAGGEIRYTLSLRNNSEFSIEPDAVFDGLPTLLDGIATELLIVRDEIPLNTNFKRIEDAVNFDPVFHRRGDAETEWRTTPPENLSEIDMVGFASEDALVAGQSRDFRFTVEIGDHTDGFIVENTGEFLLPDGVGNAIPVLSNTVATPISGEAGTLSFYSDPGFEEEIDQTPFDELLFLEVRSGLCNVSGLVDQIIVTVVAEPDGDREEIIAVETAANSGIFRTEGLLTREAPPVLIGDGVLQGRRRGVASATIGCDPAAQAEIDLSPAGAVFLSGTNEPVANARVELLDAAGQVIAETVTDGQGLYDLLPPRAGVHTVRVTPPIGLIAPSQRTNFPGFDRNILAEASFGQPFQLTSTGQSLGVDVPVDPDLTGALSVAKEGDRTNAILGEIIRYTIDVRNNAAIAIQAAEIVDTLPNGLALIKGSARLNGGPLADPRLRGPRENIFEIGLLEPNSINSLTYAVEVLPTAGEGDKLNTAFATGDLVGFDTSLVSNTAGFTIEVDNSDGVFSRDGVVLGKVFLDCDADGAQGKNEPGIPGVQIHTEEGLSVITDQYGRYSLGGLSPRTHVLNVYEASLPEGAVISASRVFDAGVGGSRFVPLQVGQIRSEDFAVVGCDAASLAAVEERVDVLEAQFGAQFSERNLQFESSNNGVRTVSNKSANGIGRFDNAGRTPSVAGRGGQIAAKPHQIKRIKATENLKIVLADNARTFGFVDLEDGDRLVQKNVSVRVIGLAGASLNLLHNGELVEQDKIGQTVQEGGVKASEYIALALAPGDNVLTLRARDDFGNLRGEETITVTSPGAPAKVELIAPETAIADPTRPVPIILQAVDKQGHPVAAPIEATLIARDDAWDVRDTSEQVPGVQTLLDEGRAEVSLLPSGLVGTHLISVETQYGRAETKIRFTPDISGPKIAVGFGEAAFGFNSNGIGTLGDVFSRDELSPFEETEEGVEGAFFVKGSLFNQALITLRHDSALETDDGLFRSVEPDEFYPVYGDQSTRGFDARSRGKTFAKVERGSSYVLFGDVAFDAAASALQLGAFQRTLEGAKAHIEAGRFSFDGYAGRTSTGQVILEIPAQGISGPYDLGFEEVIENSETVEIITRDRNQPGIILSTERLGRFSAYTVDYFARTLVFNRPIPSRDENLNPVSIRITFEADEDDAENYWLFGGEAAFAVTDWLTTGFRQLTSEGQDGSDDDRTVRAAYIDAAIGEHGRLEVEAAQSIDPLDESGTAVRLNYEQQFKRGSFGARLATTTADFDAPGASVSAGRDEARLFGNVKAGPGVLTAEALFSADATSEAERIGVVGRYEASLTGTLRVRAGSRYVDDTSSTGAREDALTVIAGIGWTPKFLTGANIDIEAEQEVTDGAQSRVSVGGDYALTPKLRLYAQADYTGSRSGSFGLTDSFNDDVSVRLGGEYRWTDRITAFSEYRANESIFDSGVANGLTASWSVSPSLNLRLRGEHVQPISPDFQRNTAIGLGGTWEPETSRYIVDGDIEYAAGQGGSRTWFASNSTGYRWKDLTFLGRNRFARTSNVQTDEVRLRDRARVGAAWRPVNSDRLNGLSWYEYELDEQAGLEERRHIWSVGGEYKLGSKIRLRGRTAGQVFSTTLADLDLNSTNTTLLFQSGADFDVHKRINLAFSGSLIGDDSFSDNTFGIGSEINLQVAKNLLLGIGYNYSGLREERIEPLFRSGAFVRLRLKFDENVWNIFERDR